MATMATTIARFARFARTRPLLFSVGTASLKTGTADAVAQVGWVDGDGVSPTSSSGFDWQRNAAFWVFGAWFLGGAQYVVLVDGMRAAAPRLGRYMALSPRRRLRLGAFRRSAALQCAFELGLWVPFAYYPMYYWTKMGIQGAPADRILAELRANWGADLRAFYAAWAPFTLANYCLTPLWLRVPAIGAYSMLWTVYLSVVRGPRCPPPPPPPPPT